MNKTQLRLPAILLFCVYTLYALAAAAYEYVATDIVLLGTLWFDAIDIVTRYVEIFGAAVLLALLVFFVYRHGARNAAPAYWLAVIALVYKYLATVLAVSLVGGAIDLTGGLVTYTVAVLMELLLAAIAVFLAHRYITPTMEQYESQVAAAKTLQQDADFPNPCYPFRTLLSFKNPVLLTLFWCIVALCVFHAASFLILFISGSPLLAADIPVMLIYLVILVLIPSALAYLVARGIFRFAARRLS